MGTSKTTDQDVEDYPDLSAEAVEAAPEETTDTAEAEDKPAEGPKFNPKKQFSMCWHDGLKAYLQDGYLFDRGDKKPIGKA